MPFSSDVTLPLETKPEFPRQCIVCHQQPDSECKVPVNTQSWMLSFLSPIFMLFGRRSVMVPTCSGCKGKFRFQRWAKEIIGLILIIAAVWWLMPRFGSSSGLIQKLLVAGAAILIISPWLIWEVIRPRYFDTTANKQQITYEFASADYAAVFEYLNREHVIESDVESDLHEEWYDRKSKMMADLLGPEHDTVLHAIIPYAVGGALDIYYYLQPQIMGQPVGGTLLATKELSIFPGQGSSNDVFSCYELVMGTRQPMDAHRLSGEENQDEDTLYAFVEQRIRTIMRYIAAYSEQACLNPKETCEFPGEMDEVGGTCLIFDGLGPVSDGKGGNFGMLLAIEICRAEMEYARKHGGAKLIEKLKEAGYYPHSDLDRASVV